MIAARPFNIYDLIEFAPTFESFRKLVVAHDEVRAIPVADDGPPTLRTPTGHDEDDLPYRPTVPSVRGADMATTGPGDEDEYVWAGYGDSEF